MLVTRLSSACIESGELNGTAGKQILANFLDTFGRQSYAPEAREHSGEYLVSNVHKWLGPLPRQSPHGSD